MIRSGDLSTAQIDVLEHLDVEELHIRAARASHRKRTLESLERRGLIELKKSSVDGAPYYRLTPGGERLLGD